MVWLSDQVCSAALEAEFTHEDSHCGLRLGMMSLPPTTRSLSWHVVEQSVAQSVKHLPHSVEHEDTAEGPRRYPPSVIMVSIALHIDIAQ